MTKWYRTTDWRPDDSDHKLLVSEYGGVYLGFYQKNQSRWFSIESDQYGYMSVNAPLCWAEVPKPTTDFLMSCRGPSQTVKDQVSEDARALHEKLKQQGIDPTDYEV